MSQEEALGASIGGTPSPLGRDPELVRLREMLDSSRTGRGRLVVVEGPTGIGKTALLGVLRAEAEAVGARWLGARGSELEREHAFGVVRQLLEPVVSAPGGDRLLSGAAELARTVLTSEHPEAGPYDERSFPVLHGLYWVVTNLAEEAPVVLAVDDLQWIDAPSMRFLDYLAVRLDGLRVLGALAVRVEEAGPRSGPVERLAAGGEVETITVGPLDAGSVAELVRRELGEEASPELCASCHHATGGNPFLLCELLRELRRSQGGPAADPAAVRRLAPPAIVRAVHVRLASLEPDMVAVARAASVMGDGADLSGVAELTGLGFEAAATAADALAADGVLEPGRPLRFRNPILRTAVSESMAAAERATLHSRAARIAAVTPGRSDRVGAHLVAGRPAADPWAVERLREAAAEARLRGATDVAVSFLRRALDEPPSPELLPTVMLELAAAAGALGEPDALELAERAFALEAAPDLHIRAAMEVGTQRTLAGLSGAIDVIEAALARGGVSDEERELAEGLLLVWANLHLDGHRRLAGRVERALARAREPGAPGFVVASAAISLTLSDGPAREVLRLAERANSGGRLLREYGPDGPFVYFTLLAQATAGELGTAERRVQETMDEAARTGSLRGWGLSHGVRAWIRWLRGDLRGAEADARLAIDAADPARLAMPLAFPAGILACVLCETGRLDQAPAALELLPADVRDPRSLPAMRWYASRAYAALAAQRFRDALVDCDVLAAWEREAGNDNGSWTMWRPLAVEAHFALGHHERAEQLADEAIVIARRYGAPLQLGLALRARGLTPGTDREETLREAIGCFDTAGACHYAALARADLGDLLSAAGRRDEARAMLGDALDAADAAGGVRLATRARDALVALGARPRRRSRTGVGALTAAELRVAQLAATGSSNRDIAQRLFLTLKTVENHLTSAYRKLGISSRTQLPDRLGAPDGGDESAYT